jgi:hypothetical protein
MISSRNLFRSSNRGEHEKPNRHSINCNTIIEAQLVANPKNIEEPARQPIGFYSESTDLIEQTLQ